MEFDLEAIEPVRKTIFKDFLQTIAQADKQPSNLSEFSITFFTLWKQKNIKQTDR